MKCFFRSFDVGIGDSCIIRLVDNDIQYVIMVDCGKYTQPLKEYLENILHNHINLLIATHIDGDHILGLATLLKNHTGLVIDQIWYNTYRRTALNATVQLSDQQKSILQQIQRILPVEFDAINYREVNAPQGISLAKVILDKEEWKQIWNMEYITDQTPDFYLPNDMGKIVLLGPTQNAMTEIEKKFKDAFDKYFMQQWDENLQCGEELQELLIRLVDAYKGKFQVHPVSATESPVHNADFIRMKAKNETKDNSDTNYSSIAFILECGEHRLAMLGDAFASTIVEAIDNKYRDMEKPINCDAIKIAHHGSKGNTSWNLLNRIIAHRYFIAGGKGKAYPTWEVLGKIAESHKDEQTKQIIFSHRGDMSEQMEALSPEVKHELGIEITINEQEYELFEW